MGLISKSKKLEEEVEKIANDVFGIRYVSGVHLSRPLTNEINSRRGFRHTGIHVHIYMHRGVTKAEIDEVASEGLAFVQAPAFGEDAPISESIAVVDSKYSEKASELKCQVIFEVKEEWLKRL